MKKLLLTFTILLGITLNSYAKLNHQKVLGRAVYYPSPSGVINGYLNFFDDLRLPSDYSDRIKGKGFYYTLRGRGKVDLMEEILQELVNGSLLLGMENGLFLPSISSMVELASKGVEF